MKSSETSPRLLKQSKQANSGATIEPNLQSPAKPTQSVDSLSVLPPIGDAMASKDSQNKK